MNLPQFSVKYPVTVAMLMTLIAILGYISFDKLGTDLLPSIYNPRIVVELQAGDRSPQEIEQRFARQLEGEAGTISRVVDVRSVCTLGRVRTTITFSWGTDMDFALLDVQKKIAHFESDPDVSRLTIARYDPQEEPIAIYALQASPDIDLDELRRISENVVKRNLERLDGVARAQVYGGLKREVRVELEGTSRVGAQGLVDGVAEEEAPVRHRQAGLARGQEPVADQDERRAGHAITSECGGRGDRSGGLDLDGQRALRPLLDLELDGLTLAQGAEAVPLDLGEVHEDVAAGVARDEPVALGVVEPLHFPGNTQGRLP